MRARPAQALLTATYGLIGFLLTQIAVVALLVFAQNLAEGNLWTLMLAPLPAASFHLATIALRNVADTLR
jgi:hypothetical protein